MTSDARLERKESGLGFALGALHQGSAPAVSSAAVPSAPSEERGTSEAAAKRAHFELDGEPCPMCQGEEDSYARPTCDKTTAHLIADIRILCVFLSTVLVALQVTASGR